MPSPTVSVGKGIIKSFSLLKHIYITGVRCGVSSHPFIIGRWYWSGHRKNSQLAIFTVTGSIVTAFIIRDKKLTAYNQEEAAYNHSIWHQLSLPYSVYPFYALRDKLRWLAAVTNSSNVRNPYLVCITHNVSANIKNRVNISTISLPNIVYFNKPTQHRRNGTALCRVLLATFTVATFCYFQK